MAPADTLPCRALILGLLACTAVDPASTDPKVLSSTVTSRRNLPLLKLMGTSSVKARPGDDVLLRCTFNVDPPPLNASLLTVKWTKKGNIMANFTEISRTAGQRFRLAEVRRRNASLFIARVKQSDEGLYRCSVKHHTLEASHLVQLKVQDEELIHPNLWRKSATALSTELSGTETDSETDLPGSDLMPDVGGLHPQPATETHAEWKKRYLEVGMVLAVILVAGGGFLALALCYKG